jgi:hypothetical protein
MADATGCTGAADGAALLKRVAIEVAWDIGGWDMAGWGGTAGASGCDTLETGEAGDAVCTLGFESSCGGG